MDQERRHIFRDIFNTFLNPRERREVIDSEQALYFPNFDVLVGAGFAGTGKTSAFDEINEAMIGTHYIKVGQKVRGNNSDLSKISPGQDINTDSEQERLMLKTPSSFPLIVESRFGPIIAADIRVRFKGESPRIINILATADKKVRDLRVWERDKKDEPDLTLEESIARTEERDRQFVARMQHLYPYLLRGQHPFDPGITDDDGNPVYDYVIDTTHIPKGKVKDAIIKALLKDGHIERFSREDFGEGESGDVAFALIKQGSHCQYDACERLARQTLDSVSEHSTYHFAICSDEHVLHKKEEIMEWASEKNVSVRFGKNGIPIES